MSRKVRQVSKERNTWGRKEGRRERRKKQKKGGGGGGLWNVMMLII